MSHLTEAAGVNTVFSMNYSTESSSSYIPAHIIHETSKLRGRLLSRRWIVFFSLVFVMTFCTDERMCSGNTPALFRKRQAYAVKAPPGRRQCHFLCPLHTRLGLGVDVNLPASSSAHSVWR